MSNYKRHCALDFIGRYSLIPSAFTFEIFPGAAKLKIEAESPMIEEKCVLVF